MTEAAKLLFWDDSWDLREKECPCDVHFIEWLDREKITGSAIYHFGTGNHHHVGIECARESRRNSVLGITAAPQEYQKYIELAIARPEVLRYYNAVFGDIYLLNPKLLPVFDVVTLFHLCEFRGERTDAYGGASDLDVVNLLTDKTRPGGHILFFTSSFAFAWDGPMSAKKVIAIWEKERPVERVGEYKSLLVYRKKG
ncbi:MAG TPA: hypothetical protein VJ526_18470 [Beijerinckiaceae bacterium]|nr:hypothetical protein [Beijerinckiaceae bacterium]